MEIKGKGRQDEYGDGDGDSDGDGDADGDVGGDGESCSQALVGHQPSSTQLLNSPNPDSNSCTKSFKQTETTNSK